MNEKYASALGLSAMPTTPAELAAALASISTADAVALLELAPAAPCVLSLLGAGGSDNWSQVSTQVKYVFSVIWTQRAFTEPQTFL